MFLNYCCIIKVQSVAKQMPSVLDFGWLSLILCCFYIILLKKLKLHTHLARSWSSAFLASLAPAVCGVAGLGGGTLYPFTGVLYSNGTLPGRGCPINGKLQIKSVNFTCVKYTPFFHETFLFVELLLLLPSLWGMIMHVVRFAYQTIILLSISSMTWTRAGGIHPPTWLPII